MPDLYVRDVDHPRGRRRRMAVTAADLDRVLALPVGGLHHDPVLPDTLRCGPLSGEWVEVAAAGRRWRLRWGPCWLPSCACCLEAWPAGRRRPVPEPGWSHVESDELPGGCVCGGYDADAARHFPKWVEP